LDVRHRALLVDRVERRREPCRPGPARSIEVVRSLGLPAHTQRFATIRRPACGCTYPSPWWIEIGYAPAIRQTRCICAEASFLIRRSNNSVARPREATRAAGPTRCQSRPAGQARARRAEADRNSMRTARARCAPRARGSDALCHADVTELGFLAYRSGREARRPKGQRGRMSVSEVPEARPENPERLHLVHLSNRAHRAVAKPQ
jgi:hypothetical protein